MAVETLRCCLVTLLLRAPVNAGEHDVVFNVNIIMTSLDTETAVTKPLRQLSLKCHKCRTTFYTRLCARYKLLYCIVLYCWSVM